MTMRAILFLIFSGALLAQTGTQMGEWRFYGGDDRGTKYSPIAQIDATNIAQLQVAWRFKSANFGPRPDTAWQVTPLMVHDTLYFTAGVRRAVVAADAATGETLWTYRFDEDSARGVVRQNNRGLGYWTDGKEERLIVITPGYQLIAVDAKTGRGIRNFGTNGAVDLFVGLDREKVEPGTIGATSPVMIVKDTAVVGAALLLGTRPKSKTNVPGFVRGYDVHTGKLKWTFRTIPRPGEFGNDTWKDGSWEFTGNTGAWAPMSADLDLGYVYLPIEMPTGDHYGGHRPGDNLFADSLVCVNAETGERVWHYQLIHHDLWDWDIPAAPVLLDVTVDGRKIKAVAQVTKQAFTYVFDRVTGQPVWPIIETPVAQSDVPGEKSSPTQPIPTKPAAFDRQGTSINDLIDFTPALREAAIRIASQYRMGPIFNPPSVVEENGTKGTLSLPHATGGANWQGAAADPETGLLYVGSLTNPYVAAMLRDPENSDMNYVSRNVNLERVDGLPLFKGPWARITAIDLNTGEHAWMTPHGEPSDAIKKHPALQGIDPKTLGGQERAGLLVTKTLLFATDGAALRVLDKATGKEIAKVAIPGGVTGVTGVPMTYMSGGRQYIVAAVGHRDGAELVAFALPRAR